MAKVAEMETDDKGLDAEIRKNLMRYSLLLADAIAGPSHGDAREIACIVIDMQEFFPRLIVTSREIDLVCSCKWGTRGNHSCSPPQIFTR